MELVILELVEGYEARFEIKNVQLAFANALRRAMMSDVPTLAIDHVNFYDNTSVFFDEMLSLRLGLIPIRGDVDSVMFQSECECGGEGCGLCQVILTLSKACEGQEELIVKSGDLECPDQETRPAQPDIPIINLKKNQRVIADAVVVKGRGHEHAKFQPTTVCGYKNRYHVVTAPECKDCPEHPCVDICPRGVFTATGGTVTVVNEADCSLCGLCIEACEGVHGKENSKISVTPLKDDFIFNVESDGSMDVAEVVVRAADTLKEKVNELSQKLAEL